MDNKMMITRSGLSSYEKKSRLPAKLDLIQSLSGLLLAIFMFFHMLFIATILISPQTMEFVTQFFEGYYIFGQHYPWIVSIIGLIVVLLLMLHALLALRKFPTSYQKYRVYRAHMKTMRHSDTSLWLWQVITGFLLFFLASAHLYQMIVYPELIGPKGSSHRVWTEGLWPYYLIMLFVVEIHGSVGLYRLVVKWLPVKNRMTLKKIKWLFTAFMLVLGVASLLAYMRWGYLYSSLG